MTSSARRKSSRTGVSEHGHAGRRGASRPQQSPADNILALVHVFSNLIGRAFDKQVALRHRLSIQQWRILLTLAHHPGATAVDIIARWALQPMGVSRAIRALEQRGWIIRRTRSRDRRSQALHLTSKGRRVYEAVVPDANERYREIVDCLSHDDLARLARSLVKLIENTKRLTTSQREIASREIASPEIACVLVCARRRS